MAGEKFIRGTEITRPTPEALSSSILDHATVVTRERDFGLQNNEGMWNSYNCLDLFTPTPTCPHPLLVDIGEYKQFDTAAWVPGFQFAVYGGVKCSAVGLDAADQFNETVRAFERGEGRGIEQAILMTRFADSEPIGSDEPLSPTHSSWQAPEKITSGDFSTVGTALAALESHAAAHYLGVPTLHMPRGVVLMAAGAGYIVERDGKFYTKTGSKVAAGGGYGDDAFAETGYASLYATGEVYIEKGPGFQHQTHTIPGDGSGTGSDENGLGDNTVISLVERQYRVAIDCYAAYVNFSAWVVSDG